MMGSRFVSDIIAYLDALSRERRLTEAESLALEKAIRQERQTQNRQASGIEVAP